MGDEPLKIWARVLPESFGIHLRNFASISITPLRYKEGSGSQEDKDKGVDGTWT